MKRLLNWIIDKWLAGFITASIFFLLKIYLELPTESTKHFFSFNWLTEILKFQISLYIVIVIIIALIIITRIEKSRATSKLKAKNLPLYPPKPNFPFENYKADTFGYKKSKWTWNYKWNRIKAQFEINDLVPSCQRCDIPMDLQTSSYGDTATCHKCRLEGHDGYFKVSENITDIEKEIIRRIDKNEYQK
jgi:hypothetical protein